MHREYPPFSPLQFFHRLAMAVACLCLSLSLAEAHSTYLRPLEYVGEPGSGMEILVLNGTFDQSQEAIKVRVVKQILSSGPGGRKTIDIGAWGSMPQGSKLWRGWQEMKYHAGGWDLRRHSRILWKPSVEGIHSLGFQLHTLRIALEAEKLASYLHEVGHGDDPNLQVDTSDPNKFFKESYTKTAKTIVRTGNLKENGQMIPLGLVAEIVPVDNPTTLKAGDKMKVLLLLHGKPLADQVLLVGQAQGIGGRGREEREIYRSDASGQVMVALPETGEWWMEFNCMRRAHPQTEVDFVTFWTTLTFKIEE